MGVTARKKVGRRRPASSTTSPHCKRLDDCVRDHIPLVKFTLACPYSFVILVPCTVTCAICSVFLLVQDCRLRLTVHVDLPVGRL